MKIKKHIPLLLIRNLLLFIPFYSLGQGVPAMINYTVDDGLPSSETHDIIQDSKGYIWIATDRGVSRYNGYEFENFTTKDGLTDNTVFEIIEDQKGRVWFFTMSMKLCFYWNNQFHPYEYNNKLLESIKRTKRPPSLVRNYYIDQNDLLAITLKDYLIEIDSSGNVNFNHFNKAKSEVYFFHYDSTLFLKSITSTSIQNQNLIHYYLNEKALDSFRIGTDKWGISKHIIDKSSYTLNVFGMNTELFKVSNNKITKVYQFKNTINCIASIGKNTWVGNYHQGITIFNDSFAVVQHLLPSESVSEIYVAKDNTIWISTITNGIYLIPSNNILNITSENSGIAQNSISAIESSANHTIYLGHPNSKVSVIDHKNNLTIYPKTPSSESNFITSIYFNEKNQTLYTGSSIEGLAALHQDHFTVLKTLDNDKAFRVLSIVKLDDIIFSTGTIGFTIADSSNTLFRIRATQDESQRVETLYLDNNGYLWGGSLNGLLRTNASLIKKDQSIEWEIFGHQIPELDQRITCIAEKDSTLWLGTRGNGIILFDKNSKTSYIDHHIGFSPRNINAILIQGNNIWVASNQGVSHIIENYPSQYTFQQINTSSGLSTNEATSLALLGDTLLVGTKKGLNIINTKTFSLNDSKKMPVFTAINVAGELVTDTNNIEITYDKNSIDFSYLTFAYGTGGDITYQYKIDELDQGWFSTKDRTARFVALPPGDYTFKVRTLKNDSSWTEANSLHFSVLPAFWQTWYFWVAIGLVFVIVISAIAYNSIKNANERSEMNARIENLRQNSLSSQMNPHFVFNVLNSILTFLLTNSQRNAAKYLSSFAWLMRKTFNLSKANKITLEEELDVLTSYFKLEKLRINDKITFQLEVDPKLDVESLMVPPLILQPFVENAILHGISQKQTRSVIAVQLTLEGDYMKVVIEDNGIGIEKSKQEKEKHPQAASHKSSGLDISKERVALLHKVKNEKALVEIIDLSSLGNTTKTGTQVTFYLPLIYED